MSTQPFDPVQPICVSADGSVLDGYTRIKPWPFLRMLPRRTLVRTQEIIWAAPGDRLWEFTRKIPPTVLALVRTSPTNPWELLELVAAAPERAGELLRRCPALALLAARSCPVDCEDRAAFYRRLVDHTWRQMLTEVGLPPVRQYVRILRKLPLTHCHENALETLHDALLDGHPHLRVLAHLRRLTRDTIALLALPPGLVNAHLLMGSGESPPEATPITWTVEAVVWLRELEVPGAEWPYGHLGPDDLSRVEARLRERLSDEYDDRAPFPPPPLPGLPGRITPIHDYWALITEGHDQNNCASFYLDEIHAGICYLYAVSGAERATLLLRRVGEGNEWILGDLRAEGNREVTPATRQSVDEWLRSACPTKTDTTKKCL